MRTSACATDGAVIRHDVKGASFGAIGDGLSDDTAAIQAAIEAAKRDAARLDGTCAVQVYFPQGTYHVTGSLFVPSRVALIGEARRDTRLLKSTDGSLIELTDEAVAGSHEQCAGVEYVAIGALSLEMRSGPYDQAKPAGSGGHCIRSAAGARYVDLRDLTLTSCNTYGLGFQIAYNDHGAYDCRASSPPYAHVSVEGVRIVRSGSDGVDFKQPEGAMNHDIVLREVCVGDVGWNDDDGSAVGFDLAGERLRLSTVTHVNHAVFYDGSAGRTYVSGIRLRSGARNVRDSLIEGFHVEHVNKGVLFEGQDNCNVTLRDGEVRHARSVDDREGDGILVRGAYHHTEGDVFVTDVSRFKLVDYGTNSRLTLSDQPPVANNPACEF